MSLEFRGKRRFRVKSLGVNNILMIFKPLRLDELYIEVSIKRKIQRLILGLQPCFKVWGNKEISQEIGMWPVEMQGKS